LSTLQKQAGLSPCNGQGFRWEEGPGFGLQAGACNTTAQCQPRSQESRDQSGQPAKEPPYRALNDTKALGQMRANERAEERATVKENGERDKEKERNKEGKREGKRKRKNEQAGKPSGRVCHLVASPRLMPPGPLEIAASFSRGRALGVHWHSARWAFQPSQLHFALGAAGMPVGALHEQGAKVGFTQL